MSITEYSHDDKGKREDVHRPSVIAPSDYELAAPLEGSGGWWQRGPFMDNGVVGKTCDHCGHSLRYYVRHVYKPTGKIVIFGEDCADFIGLGGTHAAYEFNRLKERARKEEREAKLAQEKEVRRADFTKQYPDIVEWAENHSRENERFNFLNEMHNAFDFFGYLTVGQAEATRRVLKKREEMAVQQLAEAPATPSPEGKQTIEGVIVSTRIDSGPYGNVRKMQVKLDDHNKVWGTMPVSIEDAIWNSSDDADAKGKRVSFTATFTRSDSDEHFSFYKRPTNGKVVS